MHKAFHALLCIQISSVCLRSCWGSAGFAHPPILLPHLGASFPHHWHQKNALTMAPVSISARLHISFPCSPLLHPTRARCPGRSCAREERMRCPLSVYAGAQWSEKLGSWAQSVNLQLGLLVLEQQQNTLSKPVSQNEETPVPSSLLLPSLPSVPCTPTAHCCLTS